MRVDEKERVKMLCRLCRQDGKLAEKNARNGEYDEVRGRFENIRDHLKAMLDGEPFLNPEALKMAKRRYGG